MVFVYRTLELAPTHAPLCSAGAKHLRVGQFNLQGAYVAQNGQLYHKAKVSTFGLCFVRVCNSSTRLRRMLSRISGGIPFCRSDVCSSSISQSNA